MSAATAIKRWRENPVAFVHENFQVTPDAWQVEALEAFASPSPDRQRISLQACVGPGKTALLAWCAWNFLSCYGEKGEHPKGAAVSVTGDNLKDNLWPELSKWQQRSSFLSAAFEWTKERVFAKQHQETWFLSARAWSQKSSAEDQGKTLSGLHSKYVLALIDESGTIPVQILRAAEQALSTNPTFGKILQAGNPSSLDGMLYAAASTLAHLWYRIRITGDPDDPKRSPRIDIEWARDQIKTYGRDNPWVMYSILGLFPPASINALFGPDEVAQAMDRHLTKDMYEWSQKRIGVDVARFGDDRTILFPRQGLWASKPVEMRNARGPEIAARIALARQKWNPEQIFIDDTGGWGSSVQDSLHSANIPYVPVPFSGKANDPRYLNKRAEMWFLMSEWVKRGGALPKDAGLSRELCAPTYTFHNGKFQLEEKEQIKKRLGFSPDLADALALTFAHPEMPTVVVPEGVHPSIAIEYYKKNSAKLETEWDPFKV